MSKKKNDGFVKRFVNIFKSEEEKHELVNVDVEFISLVKNPANRQDFIYKSESKSDGKSIAKTIEIQKYDEEKGIVYGAVYSPDIPDAHNDFMTAEEIEKTCHNFAKNLHLKNVDQEHNFQKTKAHVVESFILKGTHPDYPGIAEGSWVIAMKLDDDSLKEKVKKGEFKGFSMAGKAIRKSKNSTTEEENEVNKKLEKLVKGMQNLAGEIAKLQKSGGSADEIAVLNKKFEAMQKELDELKNADNDQAGDDQNADSKDSDNKDLQKSIDGLAKSFEVLIKKSNQLDLDCTEETHVNLLLKSENDKLIDMAKSNTLVPSDLEIDGVLTPDQSRYMFDTITGDGGFLGKINSKRVKKLKAGKDMFNLVGDILVRVPEGDKPTDEQKKKINNSGSYFDLLPVQAFFEIAKSTIRHNSDDPKFLSKQETLMLRKIRAQIEKLGCIGIDNAYATPALENLQKGWVQRAKEEVVTGNYIKKGTDFTTDNIFTLIEEGLAAADSEYLSESKIILSPNMAFHWAKKMGYSDSTANLLLGNNKFTHLGYEIEIVKQWANNVIMISPLWNLLFTMHTEIDWSRAYLSIERILQYIYEVYFDFGIGIPAATVLLTNEMP